MSGGKLLDKIRKGGGRGDVNEGRAGKFTGGNTTGIRRGGVDRGMTGDASRRSDRVSRWGGSSFSTEKVAEKKGLIRGALDVLTGRSGKYSNKLSRDELINAESSLGRTLFGPIPAGHQREFFESEKNVWIWYENYFNEVGVFFEMTIRYEVRPAGVFKRVNQGSYERIEGAELDNFRAAARNYLQLVKTKLYC